MTGLCGQRLTSQGRAHVSWSVRNIYAILLAHAGEAVSFVVGATKEPRQPPSHCFGDAFSFCTPRGAGRFPCPARSSQIGTQSHPRGSACSGLGTAPASPDSWLAGANCDSSDWP